MNKRRRLYFFGLFAEYYVILYMFFKGYFLVKHRYKTKLGEVDLIFKKKDYLVAVEVKARSDKNINVGEVVDNKQFFRIVNSLKIFLNKYKEYCNFCIRIDVVLIYNNLRIKHIKNIWNE